MFLVPASIQETLATLAEEKVRLVKERDVVAAELADVKSELALLGIDGGVAGLALILGQLYEERDQLRAQIARLQTGQAATQASGNLKAQVESLQEDISNLATDREAAVKQRDTLRCKRPNGRRSAPAGRNSASASARRSPVFKRKSRTWPGSVITPSRSATRWPSARAASTKSAIGCWPSAPLSRLNATSSWPVWKAIVSCWSSSARMASGRSRP